MDNEINDIDVDEGKVKKNGRHDSNMKKEIIEWIQAIAIALIVALVIRTYVFSLIKVSGPSMQPTLQDNDRLIVMKLMYKPTVGDVIILDPPNMTKGPYVKRIIATEGQEVDINFNTHKVFVDGIELSEDYIKSPTSYQGDVEFPVTIPEDNVFVMGDNRNNSKDSRMSSVGMVPFNKIEGKVTIRLWPLNKFGTIYED